MSGLDNFDPVEHVDSLQMIDILEGQGDVAAAGSTVTVDYTGAIAATGVVFQSSKDFGRSITFGLNQVIAGWRDGIPGMKVGGTRRLLIPAKQAYGSTPPPGSGIPADADLVFDVNLHAIES
jgi:peptidylprolyl isomerase